MSRCARGSDQVLVGTDRIKLTGLRETLKKIRSSGLTDPDAVVDRVMEELGGENYIPPGREPLYRTAVWREYLRLLGEDYSAFLSEMPVTVQADPGEERDRFETLLVSVFAEFELKPVVTHTTAPEGGPQPRLIVRDEVVAEGDLRREELKAAVSRSISGW